MKRMGESIEMDPLFRVRAEFQEIRRSIELESEQVRMPRIEMSDFGLNELAKLEKEMDEIKVGDIPGLIAVMRGWNLDNETMNSIFKRVNMFKASIPELKGLFFVINNDGDTDNITEKSLQSLVGDKKNEIPMVPLKVNNYTWTAGLNSAAAILNEISLGRDINRDKIKILNISYGVDLEKEDLVKCSDSVRNNRITMSVRKSDTQESIPENKDFFWEKFKQLIRNPNDEDLNYVLRSMRNTFNTLSLSDIVKFGGFNPATNALGGMEDADFNVRMILNALKSGRIEMIKEFKKAIDNPVYYSDYRWMSLKDEKDPSEMAALKRILEGISLDDNIKDNNYILAESMQDFRLRNKN